MIYFCKVDIKACFDSMNQVRLIELVEEVMNEVEYTISNYSSMQFDKGKVRRRFLKTAQRDGMLWQDHGHSLLIVHFKLTK